MSNILTPLQHETLKILVSDTSFDRPISGKNIALRIHLKEKQGLQDGNFRQIIHALRVKGYPICANSRGYFYAKNEQQLSKFIVQLQSRIMAQEEALKALKNSFHNVGKEKIDQPMFVDIYVKTLTNSQKVLKIKVPIDELGNPIVPPNLRLV